MRWNAPLLGAITILLLVTAPSPTVAQQPAGPGCHESYWGWCVPIDVSDVDCIGGSGDGPVYVGRVLVVGVDEYRLDTDGDGIGCDNSPTGPLW